MGSQQNAIDHIKRYLMLNVDGTWRILQDVAIVGVSFMLFFTAYGGTVNLQSSINAEDALGTSALAALFFGFVISSLFLPPILIRWLGSKWTMCVTFLTFVPYIVFQMYPKFYTLIPSAFFLGLGGGPCWSAMCTYIALAAEAHHVLSKIPAAELLQRFLGIFFMFYQLNEIFGNMISSIVLSTHNAAAETVVNDTKIPQLCGANFLPYENAKEALPPQPPEKIQFIMAIYLVIMGFAALLMALLLDSMKTYEASRQSQGSAFSLLILTMQQLADPDQLLLLPLNMFIGLYQAFFMAVFTASFVSCAIGIGSVGFVMMTYGVSDAIGCIITGVLAHNFGRMPLFVGATFLHSILLTTMLLWHPHHDEFYILFIIAVFWGLCDSVWLVQINAHYGVLFRGNEAAAFANFWLWEAIGYIITYMVSPYVKTMHMVYLLFCFLVVGMICYFIVEYRQALNLRRVFVSQATMPTDLFT